MEEKERLTYRDDDGNAAMKGKSACIERLAAYEDTGLSPAEISRILDAYGRGQTLRTESWVPVTERLPETIPCIGGGGTAYSETVLVITSCRLVMTAVWNGKKWIAPFDFWSGDFWGEDELKITHWMPLPPLPEEYKGYIKDVVY